MNQDKWIYTFTLNKEISVPKSEQSKDEAGNEITITKNIKEKKPFAFKIRKPSRKIIEDADIFYAAKVGEYLKAGLLTKNLIAKRFENDGGDLGEFSKKQYTEALTEFYETQLKIEALERKPEADRTEEEKKNLDELKKNYSELKESLTEFEMERNSIFDQSAESKALSKQIFWYILNLTFFDNGQGNEKFEPYFKGDTFDEKSDSYDERESSEDQEFFATLTSKLAFAVSFWFNSGAKITQKEIDDAEKTILS